MKNIIFLFCALFILTCTATTSRKHMYSPVEVSIDTEMVADIQVDVTKKLTGTSRAVYWLIFRLSGDNKYAEGYGVYDRYGAGVPYFSPFSPVSRVKSAAAYNAISKGEGDILINPTYVIKRETTFYGKITLEVTVVGYDGKIAQIENVKRDFQSTELKLDKIPGKTLNLSGEALLDSLLKVMNNY